MPGPRLLKVGLVLFNEGELISVKNKVDQIPKCLEKVVLRKRPEKKEGVVRNIVVFHVG